MAHPFSKSQTEEINTQKFYNTLSSYQKQVYRTMQNHYARLNSMKVELDYSTIRSNSKICHKLGGTLSSLGQALQGADGNINGQDLEAMATNLNELVTDYQFQITEIRKHLNKNE